MISTIWGSAMPPVYVPTRCQGPPTRAMSFMNKPQGAKNAASGTAAACSVKGKIERPA